jgi:hypothetical protein
MKNNTTNKMFSNTQNANGQMVRSSAEWVMEAPWSGGVLPLASFENINFTNCSFSSTSGGNQSIPRIQSTATTTGWVSDCINMDNSSGVLKDQTSQLNSTNNGFSVQWLSSN